MALNPFLGMLPEPAPPCDALNPFSCAAPASPPYADNPFATSNPFAECGAFPADAFAAAAAGPFAPERAAKPTELTLGAPAPRALPPETQHLILSVTGQMDLASSHLLDRIPATRTPSPVSARDLHSPSPTPEPEPEELPEDPPAPTTLDHNRNEPAPGRPPPARPPRPAPPPPARPAPPDDINLFAAPAPLALKPTKEAILSLYTAPARDQSPLDFLSDDIVDDAPPAPLDWAASAASEPDGNPFAGNDAAVGSPTGDVFGLAAQGAPAGSPGAGDVFGLAGEGATAGSPGAGDVFGLAEEGAPAGSPGAGDVFGLAEEGAPAGSPGAGDVFGLAEEGTPADSTGAGLDAGLADAFGLAAPEPTQVAHDWGATCPEPGWASAPAKPGWSEASEPAAQDAFPESQDAFDAFSAKFDSTAAKHMNTGAWGEQEAGAGAAGAGFEAEDFDPFLSMGAAPPPPAATPHLEHQLSADSGDDTFSVFIRPKESAGEAEPVPALAPPPRVAPEPPARANPFDERAPCAEPWAEPRAEPGAERRASAGSGADTPPTPLFDEDMSVPLEQFPRVAYAGPGWEMQLRQPNKKKITGQRFWKKVFVRLAFQGDNPVVQLLTAPGDKEPFQELPLQACYSVSEVGAQQFDQFGKIFTVKLQYVFYKERPGVRPGQVTKAERITNKLSQFAAYAIQGDYQGVKEFGSDLRKLGLPVEHAPQVSQLFKLGSLVYEDVKQFSCCVEEALFRLPAHRDRALTYKMEEVQITAVDELYVEQDAEGSVLKQIARVRLFFLGFLSGMPDVELGVNDLRRQGKEVVGRHDIIPVVTEEWIRVEDAEFHACVQPEEFAATQIIKFKPPDACYIELMRFRVRPPKNRELPLQLKALWCVTGNKVELRADVLVPGFASRKLGQVPCEDVAIRFPIPECWIYLFRVEKHFRYGSVKSAHRRTGKIKGIERFLGAVDTLSESLIEVTSGQAKYEHQHRAIVWRMPRLPKEGQGAYTTHNLVSRMALTSFDQVPAELARWAYVEFTMPATQVSHMTVRSVSLQQHDGDPPEKYVRYLARHEYIVGIERTAGQAAPAYALAASTEPRAEPAPAPSPAAPQPPSSDSDSD